MKLTVLGWLKDVLLVWIAKIIEVTFRIILLCLPLWVFLLVIQGRGKVSSVSNLTNYTTDKSVWQHVFPGFILVALDSNQLKDMNSRVYSRIQSWLNRNKYTLAFLFMVTIVCLMIFN